ncbi:murein transglycosylase A [Thalassospira profundimaris]|uniref:peptidoglycan lytic exotransglycosylase n=1 Tax=Thalassospira profundimaris TaxID=502049 RepID=A0A367X5Z0_9PROT|nr:murein transglycosylase A [Thalassospira profundimaris]RCK49098.1 murein transglycosylase [Thalassospira profundimaris]
MKRRLVLSRSLSIISVLVGAGAALIWMFWPQITGQFEAPPKPEDELSLRPATFTMLDGWQSDDMRPAIRAFARSCKAMLRRDDDKMVGPDGRMGTIGQWRNVCEMAVSLDVDALRKEDARAFFESDFKPYLSGNANNPEGLFTGYYEPELRGSLTREGPYQTPIYLKPDDMISVDLGDFSEELKGKKLVGRLTGSNLKPYFDRAAIEQGALSGRDLEMVWVDDAVDAFFLQIQGSGRVVLPDNSVLRIGYAATNGHPYFAIGRELIERGALTRETVSLQTIRKWLHDNPGEADGVMNTNASFVFFRPLQTDPNDPTAGPLGSQGVALEPGRSLAVDRRFHAMGVPVWVETRDPMNADRSFNRMMIAQDTGGAIRGPVRGDIFFGPGEDAALFAGHMNRKGQKYVLLPNSIDPASWEPKATQ